MKRLLLAIALVLAMAGWGWAIGDDYRRPKGGISSGLGIGVGGGGLGYLLNDSFATDRVEGAINGTLAEPGPGTRVVIDTGDVTDHSGLAAITHKFSNICFDGNSLIYGTNASDRYHAVPALTMGLLGSYGISGNWLNNGVNAQTTPEMTIRALTTTDPRFSSWQYAPNNNIVVAWEITNDLVDGSDAATAYANIVAYCQARQAAGYKVVLLTCMVRNQAAPFEANRTTVNNNLRANWATFCDALVDLDTDSRLTDYTDVAYFGGDGIHLTDAGYLIVAGLVSPAINSLVTTSTHKGLILTGKGTGGNPGYWLDAVTRTASQGLEFTFQVPAAQTTMQIMAGWTTAQVGTANKNNLLVNGSGSLQAHNGGSWNTITPYSDDTVYQVRSYLRGTGAVHRIKGGTYSDWTTLFVSDYSNDATVYPSFIPITLNMTGLCKEIKCSKEYWLPTPLMSDGFTGFPRTGLGSSDGLGHAETSGTGSGGSGVAWVRGGAGTWAVNATGWAINSTPGWGATLNSGNLVVGQYYKIVATEVDHFFTGCLVNDKFRAEAATALNASNTVKTVSAANLSASADLAESNVWLGILPQPSRAQSGLDLCIDDSADPQNMIRIYKDHITSKIRADQCLSGVWTNLIEAAAGGNVRLEVWKQGNTIRVWHGGVYKGTATIDATLINNTKHGIFSDHDSTSVCVDNWFACGLD